MLTLEIMLTKSCHIIFYKNINWFSTNTSKCLQPGRFMYKCRTFTRSIYEVLIYMLNCRSPSSRVSLLGKFLVQVWLEFWCPVPGVARLVGAREAPDCLVGCLCDGALCLGEHY